MKPTLIWYGKCSTCQKASRWLKDNNISFDYRDIIENRPTVDELSQWIPKSAISVAKWFNTSGVVYRELGLKDKLSTMEYKELVELLSTNGKLVKRPILVTSDHILVGFNEKQWEAAIIG